MEWRKHPHENLDAYKLAKRLVSDLYLLTAAFPSEEKFGLVSQIRRAAVSVPVNVAEGASRGSKREFSRFLQMARGSVNELRVLLELSRDLGFLDAGRLEYFEEILNRLFGMTTGLIRRSNLLSRST